MNAKAGEAIVLRQGSDIYPALAKVEHRRIVDDFLGLPVDHFVHPHRFLEHRAAVKELQTEAESLSGPLCPVGAKADRVILVVIEFG
jgi:hypothetical protein